MTNSSHFLLTILLFFLLLLFFLSMFSLAIDFFDEFGLERLTEPEKPLNEMSSDCKLQLDKERALIKERL